MRTSEGHNQDPLPADAQETNTQRLLHESLVRPRNYYLPYFSPRPPWSRSDPSVGQQYHILGWPSRLHSLIPTKGPFRGERCLERSHAAAPGCECRMAHPGRKSERLESELCARLTKRRTKREIEENSWEARKASRVEKWSVVKARNPTRGEPASEATWANCEVISSLRFWLLSLPALSAPAIGPKRGKLQGAVRKYKGHERSVSTGWWYNLEGLRGTVTSFLV